jgi:tetratricopeptide (TPR) repeat protein
LEPAPVSGVVIEERTARGIQLRIRMTLAALILVAAASVSAQTPVERSKALIDARKYAEARAILEPLGKSDPAAAFYLGQIAMEQNDPERAVNWFEKAVELNPRSSVYYDWLGRSYGQQAQRASKLKLPFLANKTKSAWDKSLALDPDNLDTRQDLVMYYLQAPGFLGGGRDRARAMAQEVAKRNPYRGAASWFRICNDEKDQPCIERQLNFLISNYPDSAYGYTASALYYSTNNQAEKAFAILDQRLKARPNDPAALYAYGRAASVSGLNLDRGRDALTRYISAPIPTGPPVSRAHYHLGLIFEKKGDKAGARSEYQAALRIDPGLADAKKALDGLR